VLPTVLALVSPVPGTSGEGEFRISFAEELECQGGGRILLGLAGKQ